MFGLGSFFVTVLRKLLFLWVKTKVNGNAKLALDPDKPVCYVLQYGSLSGRLVLEQVCINTHLPSSRKPLTIDGMKIPRSFFFLYRTKGHWFRRRQSPVLTRHLRELVHGVVSSDASSTEGNPADVQIVPVSLFWGRSPQKEKSLFKIMFSDTWSTAGSFKKLLIILLQGRNTFVQFSKPISLRKLIDDQTSSEELAVRKSARILRVHFRRVRQAVLGPDLSHRRTLVSSLIRAKEVKAAIEETAKNENMKVAKVRARAFKYGDEIASNVSIATIRFLDVLLSWVWNKIYDGVTTTNVEAVQEVAKENAVIYVPCHRSHIDYLLLSYVLFHNGIMVPHIAAGINLNMPIVGPILRRGGAFFMRRSFRDNPLYAAVFNEYMHSMLTRGHSVEYFVEGGRSRTGRTLIPKAGMVSMTVRSFLRNHHKPIAFVPVYVGYEKVLEARTYLGELRGKKKEKESILGVLKTLRDFRNSFGRVNVNFGEPIYLESEINKLRPQWKTETFDDGYKPPWLNDSVTDICNKIAVHINDAVAINPVNVVATILLSTARQSMDKILLADTMRSLIQLLRDSGYSSQIGFPEGTPEDWIKYVEAMGLIFTNRQELGDIVSTEGNNAILLTYYRNNSLHVFALPALIACFFQNSESMSRDRLVRLVQYIYPYLKSELFIRWREDELESVINRYLDQMIANHWLVQYGDTIVRPTLGSTRFVMLKILSKIIIQTLERYFIAIAVLRKRGNGSITANELEVQSTQMAQRMSILYGLNAPEFFDKSLFRNFIATLKNKKIVKVDQEGLLYFKDELNKIADDAPIMLSSELRQGILQVTNLNE
ncbi:MAG: glycerol-3-phosphate 1-O-acyltransferase [Gammaproteobacteria bacterium]|nr:MAG: glycerol-3-phosphate 1-O-acyltransferase [Gammaproteobacteria bacterium]